MDFNLLFEDANTPLSELLKVQYDISANRGIITETKHEIVTSDETYKDLNGKKIREQLEKSLDQENLFFRRAILQKE